MPRSLRRVVYRSDSHIPHDDKVALQAIFKTSLRNNRRDAITGALALPDGKFVQVIEGTPGALDGLLRRLAPDPRHRDIVILDRRPIAERRFTDWTMASSRIGPETAPVLERLMATPAASADEIVALLHEALEVGQSRAA